MAWIELVRAVTHASSSAAIGLRALGSASSADAHERVPALGRRRRVGEASRRPARPAATSAGSLMRITRCGMGICDCWWCSRVLHSPAPSPHARGAARPARRLATPDRGGVMWRRMGRIGSSQWRRPNTGS